MNLRPRDNCHYTAAMFDRDEAQSSRVTFLLFLGITLLIGMDVASDLLAGSSYAHVSIEGSILALACTGLLRMLAENLRLHRQTRHLRTDLDRSLAEAAQWKRDAAEALAGLGSAIAKQFQRWSLTPAEEEVALLLLKGFSLKEIATLRDVSERTVRDQARAVYRKGKLDGRAQLSAFFLEDLLAPR